MYAATRGDLKAFYGDLVRKDTYLIQDLGANIFEYVIDIGGNCGMFTAMMKYKYPQAVNIVLEPCKTTFRHLEENTCFMEKIHIENAALGDGSDLYFYNMEYSGMNIFHKDARKGDSYAVKSYKLPQIFDKYNINRDSTYFIKVDCEGGERFLLNDHETTEIVKGCGQMGMEVHFPSTKEGVSNRFDEFPTFDEYDNWVKENLSDTHEVSYHHSCGKHGYGTFVFRSKELIELGVMPHLPKI